MNEVPANAPRKPAWPLFLLAGLSFIPGLGFLVGSVAAGWGLVSSRPRALVAAAIGAGGALLNLAACFVLVALVDRGPAGAAAAEAQVRLTRQSLTEVAAALEDFRKAEGRYPPNLMVMQQRFGLRRPVNILDPTAGFLPPRPLQYRLAPDGTSYDLFAVGRDRKPDTDDDIRAVDKEEKR